MVPYSDFHSFLNFNPQRINFFFFLSKSDRIPPQNSGFLLFFLDPLQYSQPGWTLCLFPDVLWSSLEEIQRVKASWAPLWRSALSLCYTEQQTFTCFCKILFVSGSFAFMDFYFLLFGPLFLTGNGIKIPQKLDYLKKLNS